MLKVMDQDYYDAVVRFAQSNDLLDDLQKQLDFLSAFGGDPNIVECRLYKDHAPYSFYFEVFKGEKCWFNGGCIFHGAHDRGGDGSFPTLSVCLNPSSKPHWQLHT